MNATEQREAARRLSQALQDAGIEVRRGTRRGSNLSGFEPVHAEVLVGAWIRMGWWVAVEER